MAEEPKNLDEEFTRTNDRPVTIAEARSEFEASLIVTALAAEGIQAHAFDRFRQALPFHSHFSRIPVQVRAADEVAAREVLARRAEESVDIDWDQVDVGERVDQPAFGRFERLPLVVQIAFSIAIVIILLMLIAMLLSALF